MKRHIGHLRAQFNQRHAQLALLGRQAGQRGGYRRGHDRPDAEVGRTDHIVDVAKRRRVGCDDMDIDSQPVGMQPDRVMHSLDPIDRVKRRMGVKHDLAVAVDRILSGDQQLVDIRLLDLVPAKLDFDIGNVADQPAGGEARPDIVDGHTRYAFGDLDRLAHSHFACFHVGHIAALDPTAFALACAEHAQPPVGVASDDQRGDLG